MTGGTTVTDKVGRRIPKGYYMRIKKGTSKQQIKELLFTKCDSPTYNYDYTVGSVFNATLELDRDVVVANPRGCGYSWFRGLDLTGLNEFFYDSLGDW